MDNWYVITGGPGAGKTTLLSQLQENGFSTVAEDARRIIQQETASGGDGLPWKNSRRYTMLMLQESTETYACMLRSDSSKIHFFDRGILDAFCYADMMAIDLPIDVKLAAFKLRYNRKVFILPPWREIYRNDRERKQDWQQALLTYEKMKVTYHKYGYRLIEVPKESPLKRAEFVLGEIGH